MRIVMNGQQAFGAAVLEALLEGGEDVVAVYCAPDKPDRPSDPLGRWRASTAHTRATTRDLCRSHASLLRRYALAASSRPPSSLTTTTAPKPAWRASSASSSSA